MLGHIYVCTRTAGLKWLYICDDPGLRNLRAFEMSICCHEKFNIVLATKRSSWFCAKLSSNWIQCTFPSKLNYKREIVPETESRCRVRVRIDVTECLLLTVRYQASLVHKRLKCRTILWDLVGYYDNFKWSTKCFSKPLMIKNVEKDITASQNYASWWLAQMGLS